MSRDMNRCMKMRQIALRQHLVIAWYTGYIKAS